MNTKNMQDPDIDLDELKEPLATIVFTQNEVDALIFTITAQRIEDLNRIGLPLDLTKALHNALRGLKLARKAFISEGPL